MGLSEKNTENVLERFKLNLLVCSQVISCVSWQFITGTMDTGSSPEKNRLVSSAKMIDVILFVRTLGKSLIHNRKSKGPSEDPCGMDGWVDGCCFTAL